ncbi:MAG: ATP-binding cassette domain-containing protein, partial [Muribaculaceae bacterium]|nr:ATP-binding cassette domain-containing protein [Muribaculaceae bacterium]
YKVPYSQFVVLRKDRVEQQMRAYENQQKMIAETKDFIERFRYKPTKAVQVQSRIKQLEKIVPIEVDQVDNSHLRLKFPPAPRSGDYPVILENVGKAYGDHQVFDHAEFTVKRGEKVAFVGKNGEGKSTLVKCIMSEIPYTGNLKIGHNVKIGYFAQNQAQLLDGSLTVFETIDRVAVGDIRTKIRDILGAFMFGDGDIDKKVSVLSGGEKTRLAMIKLLLEPVNLLILDEPTNHLDMRTKDILKDAVKAFEGTVIVVSHDRQFLDGLVDKVYEFGGGMVKENLGGIYDFLRKKNLNDLKDIERKNSISSQTDQRNVSDLLQSQSSNTVQEKRETADFKTVRKRSYAEQKEMDKIIRKAEKNVKAAEDEISRLETLLSQAEAKMAQGEHDDKLLNEYYEMSKQLENQMSIWELACQELEKLKE